jgi:hypothetical protein
MDGLKAGNDGPMLPHNVSRTGVAERSTSRRSLTTSLMSRALRPRAVCRAMSPQVMPWERKERDISRALAKRSKRVLTAIETKEPLNKV